MPRVRLETVHEVEAALRVYEKEVRSAPSLEKATADTYIRHAQTFVRWLNDDFVPGGGQNQS